jgi:hypothetical protein
MPDGIDPARVYNIPQLKMRKKKGVQLTSSKSIKELVKEGIEVNEE